MRKLLLIGAMGALLALLVSACGGSSGGGGSISVAQEGEGGTKSVSAACERNRWRAASSSTRASWKR